MAKWLRLLGSAMWKLRRVARFLLKATACSFVWEGELVRRVYSSDYFEVHQCRALVAPVATSKGSLLGPVLAGRTC